MSLSGTARRLMVIVDEDVSHDGQPLYSAIVRRAHDCGLAGASAFRGIEGFGRTRALHSSRILSMAENLPVMVIVIDTPNRIEDFLAQLADFEIGGVVAIDDVEVVGPGQELPTELL